MLGHTVAGIGGSLLLAVNYKFGVIGLGLTGIPGIMEKSTYITEYTTHYRSEALWRLYEGVVWERYEVLL